MNSNRGQYNSAPLYNMKNRRRQQEEKPAGGQAPKPAGKRFKVLSVVLSAVLPALFLLSLLIPSNTLRWFFLGAAAVSILVMWALRAFVKSARNTLTVVYGALAVVIGLALFMNSQSPESRSVSAGRTAQNADQSAGMPAAGVNALLASAPTDEPEEEESPEANKSAAQQQLEAFFEQWALFRVDEMVKYCQPAWVNSQTSPETTLYQMVQGSRPAQVIVEKVEGSDGDSTRTITVKALFTENSGNQVWKRMQVLMFRVNDVWYVGPQSLGGVVVDESEESGGPSATMPASTIAPTSTPSPNGGSGITVYYNQDGGKYYHAIPNCSWVDEKYWPLTGFSFDLINSQEFKALVRCPNCNPPERPAVGQ